MQLSVLFPDEDHRLSMRFARGSAEEFFAPTPGGARLLEERARGLGETPAEYAALLPEGEPLHAEMISMLRGWPGARHAVSEMESTSTDACVELGPRLEPDFLLLARDGDGAFGLRAGCVCCPSSWSLAEKMGRTVEEIHGGVPGLNTQLARPISGFLAKMPPGISWLRRTGASAARPG